MRPFGLLTTQVSLDVPGRRKEFFSGPWMRVKDMSSVVKIKMGLVEKERLSKSVEVVN